VHGTIEPAALRPPRAQYGQQEQRMTTNFSLYYALYPYRQLPPLERLRIIRASIMTPIGTIRGIAFLIEVALQRTTDGDPAIFELQRNLAELGNGLHTTILELTQPERIPLDQADAALATFRDNAEVSTQRLQTIVTQEE
jgi:hypothetical protein